MLLLLAGTYSTDGICVGLISIFIAYCLKVFMQKNKIKISQILVLLILFLLMLFAKSGAYIFVGIIIFILPLLKFFKDLSKKNKILLFIVAICVCLMFLLLLFIKSQTLTSDVRGGDTNSTAQINFLLSDYKNIITVIKEHLKNSIFNFGWLEQMHHKIFFGNISGNVFLILSIFILYNSITDDSYNFKIKEKIIFILSFVITYALISLILYLTFTPVGTFYIQGCQTRYLFPILFLLLITLSSDKLKPVAIKNSIAKTSLIYSIFLVISVICLIIY